MIQVILNDIMMNKTYPESGANFGSIIKNAIINNEKVRIDMSGVDSIPTMFMTTSLGAIMKEYGVERLKKTLIFNHITKVQIEKISKYINDYAEVYNIKG